MKTDAVQEALRAMALGVPIEVGDVPDHPQEADAGPESTCQPWGFYYHMLQPWVDFALEDKEEGT